MKQSQRIFNMAAKLDGCAKNITVFSLLITGLCLFCGVIGVFLPKDDSKPAPPKQAAAPAEPEPEKPAATQKRRSFQPGDGVLLVHPGGVGKVVLIAATNADLSEYAKLSDADDFVGIAKMVQQRRLFICDNGCPAKMIKPGFIAHEVRIMGGPSAGESGLIAKERVIHQEAE